jgi:transglutaminase-like putative cysteine protease
MTTITNSHFTRWIRRLEHTRRTLFAPGDGFILILVLVLVLMPVLALSAAGWPLDLRTLAPVVGLSLGFGFLLARSQYNEIFALIVAGVYGVGFVALLAAVNEEGGIGEGVVSVLSRVAEWILAAATGGINQDDLVFTLLVAILFWFLGYNIAWHTFRVDRVWRVILPPGLILVANNLYYTGETNLNAYLLVFIFVALLLLVRSTLDARSWEWYISGIRVPKSVRGQFMRVGAVLALLALLIAVIPQSKDLQDRLNRFQEFLQSDPLTELSELWNRLFSSVETQGPTTSDYYGGDSLQLGGAIKLGEQLVFLVQAPQGRRYYWRSRVMDTYSNGRWIPGADVRLTVEQAPLQITYEADSSGARSPVQQQFTLALNASRLIYAAPQPAQVDLPARTDLMYSPSRAGMNVSVVRPIRVLTRGDTYTVISLMSDAAAGQLRAAGANYPEWIRQQYLQIPPSITEQTRQLAQQIVAQAGAATPYDQSRAIETWLRFNIVYNETIPQPPIDRDPVEWVLFDIRQGYCNYYASAMIMLLRTLGIPSRMAAGFAQGTFDADQKAFTVLERDAHTWVEVYFPGYGWIEFEPTSAQAPLNRIDDAPSQFVPTPTPALTPTPTPTPTPSPSPTAVTPLPQLAPEFPTVTPTPSPSPTATPVIVPTQPPTLTPQQPSFLSLVVRALSIALLVLLTITLLIGAVIFTYWWWEWRGMRGLSPITRAYARLERFVTLIGIQLTGQQTPDERRQIIARRIPKAEPPVSAIASMYAAERYGPESRQADNTLQAELADEAWLEARSRILRRFLRRYFPWLKG